MRQLAHETQAAFSAGWHGDMRRTAGGTFSVLDLTRRLFKSEHRAMPVIQNTFFGLWPTQTSLTARHLTDFFHIRHSSYSGHTPGTFLMAFVPAPSGSYLKTESPFQCPPTNRARAVDCAPLPPQIPTDPDPGAGSRRARHGHHRRSWIIAVLSFCQDRQAQGARRHQDDLQDHQPRRHLHRNRHRRVGIRPDQHHVARRPRADGRDPDSLLRCGREDG